MKIVRFNRDNIYIEPDNEEERTYLETQIGWHREKDAPLNKIICELKGYETI